MDMATRLNEAMRDAGFGDNQSALSRASGVPQPTINRILKGGGKRGPETETVRKLAAACNVSFSWLLEGRGPKKPLPQSPASFQLRDSAAAEYALEDRRKGDRRATEKNVEKVNERGNLVPLISWVHAGGWCEAQDPYNVGDAEEWLSCPVSHGPKTYALRVRGESMRNPGSKPSFEDGDVIFVDPDRAAMHKSLVITKLDGTNEVTFKRLLIDGQTWFLEALNPAWPNRIIQIKTEAHVCGVVIAKMESFV